MQPFATVTAVAAPIDERNLDTNQLCPTRFNKIPVNDPDYQRILFNNQRFADDGSERADFILNQSPYRNSGILVADDNFGCGSSRESAVYALLAFGIRCVIAPSFGDIFASNAAKNGLLTVQLDNAVCDTLRQNLHEAIGAQITVDLVQNKVTGPTGSEHDFILHPTIRHNLMNGLDDVGITLNYLDEIEQFESSHMASMPWLFEETD